MIPMKKILCPTDFGEPSREAVKVASEFASYFGGELCLVHVVSPVPVMPFPEGIPPTFDIRSYQEELEVSSKKALEEIIGEMKPRVGNFTLACPEHPLLSRSGGNASGVVLFLAQNPILLLPGGVFRFGHEWFRKEFNHVET